MSNDPKIREVDDSALCISRRRRGKGFSYHDKNGKRISDTATLKRLKALVVPPMWDDVWLCRFPDGHIQAVGRDARNRKQYIYHELYEKQRQAEKFNKLPDFSGELPRIRRRAHKDLKRNGWPKSKIVALIVLLLDEYGIRIGNREYKRQNNSYGLTTLRRKHLAMENEELTFLFTGKGGQEQQVHIDNEELVTLIKESAENPGYEIFRYKGDTENYQPVDSDDVNAYIATHMGDSFSSKYFRTWAANRLAVEMYPIALETKEKEERKKFRNIVLEMIASELGNTPAICRDYYLHPAIYDCIDTQSLPFPNPYRNTRSIYQLSASEKLAREIIENSDA